MVKYRPTVWVPCSHLHTLGARPVHAYANWDPCSHLRTWGPVHTSTPWDPRSHLCTLGPRSFRDALVAVGSRDVQVAVVDRSVRGVHLWVVHDLQTVQDV